MSRHVKPIVMRERVLLLADDEETMRALVEASVAECEIPMRLTTVRDGVELMTYLRHEEPYTNAEFAPQPDIILLDLNMPRKSGLEALAEIKEDTHLRRIPIIALTARDAEEELEQAYDLGISAYITKPIGFDDLCRMMNALAFFWFNTAKLPRGSDRTPPKQHRS